MDNMLLFPGAIVYHGNNIPRLVLGVFDDLMVIDSEPFPIDQFEPVPITPDLLQRLEGQNGEKFEYDSLEKEWVMYRENVWLCTIYQDQASWLYWWKEDHSVQIQHAHELQARIFLDCGILLKLKD